MFGASGAIAGVVVLFAFNFPRATILLFFVFPMPMWVWGWESFLRHFRGDGGHPRVERSLHGPRGGAAFGLLYYLQGWNLTRWSGGLFTWPGSLLNGARSLFHRRPRLQVHKPDDEPPHPDFSAEVDRILEKIYREGEASLTPKERQTLGTAPAANISGKGRATAERAIRRASGS